MAGLYGKGFLSDSSNQGGMTEVNLGGRYWLPYVMDYFTGTTESRQGDQLLKRYAEATRAGVALTALSPADKEKAAAYSPGPVERLVGFFGGPKPPKYVTEPKRVEKAQALPDVPQQLGSGGAGMARPPQFADDFFPDTSNVVDERNRKRLEKIGVTDPDVQSDILTHAAFGVTPEKSFDRVLKDVSKIAKQSSRDPEEQQLIVRALLTKDSKVLDQYVPTDVIASDEKIAAARERLRTNTADWDTGGDLTDDEIGKRVLTPEAHRKWRYFTPGTALDEQVKGRKDVARQVSQDRAAALASTEKNREELDKDRDAVRVERAQEFALTLKRLDDAAKQRQQDWNSTHQDKKDAATEKATDKKTAKEEKKQEKSVTAITKRVDDLFKRIQREYEVYRSYVVRPAAQGGLGQPLPTMLDFLVDPVWGMKYRKEGGELMGLKPPYDVPLSTLTREGVLQKALEAAQVSQGAKATPPVPQKVAPTATKATSQGGPITEDVAAALLLEAGGDKDKARQLAKDRGYTW